MSSLWQDVPRTICGTSGKLSGPAKDWAPDPCAGLDGFDHHGFGQRLTLGPFLRHWKGDSRGGHHAGGGSLWHHGILGD